LGNPWILAAIVSQWGYAPKWSKRPDWIDFYETVRRHLQEFQAQGPKSSGHYRKLLIWYSRGCPGASHLRSRLMEMNQPRAMMGTFHEWIQILMERRIPFLPRKVPELANGNQ
jgi:tRNA-dihydrouridine synthase